MTPEPHVTPGRDGIPLVDVSGLAPSSAPIQQMLELSRQYGPVLRWRRHGGETLLVGSAPLVEELSDEGRFAKHIGPVLENVRLFTADGLFTARNSEPNWAKAHDLLMPAFALGSIRAYHPAMLRVARRLIRTWDAAAASGRPVDVGDDMTRMTLDTIGLVGFGFDFGSFERSEPHPFVGAMVRCLEWSMTHLGAAPGALPPQPDAAFRADADLLFSVVDEVIDTRRRAAPADAAAEDQDLLRLMLTARHPADGTTLDPANIRHQVITFLIAGHETTSGALSFTLYHLLKDPAALRTVQREADALWGDSADPQPAFEDIGRLRHTRQAVNEALRLWPTAAAFSREARADTLIGGRIPVRAGEAVTVLTPVLHRDPVWGLNPELFDPARFAAEAERDRPPHAYKPFGTGERACIGRQFALHEAVMLVALLVHRYRFDDCDDYRLDVKETLTLKPRGLRVVPLPRTPADRAADAAELTGPLPVRGAAAAPTPPPPPASASTSTPSRVRTGTRLLLLHGSTYGTCRRLAQELAYRAQEIGFEAPVVAALDDYRDGLPTDRPVVVVAASYNGAPTEDAHAFVSWLEGAGEGAAEGVTYAVLGVGDRNWAATYQRIPTLIDERLAALGGDRLTGRGAADASGDLSGDVRAFAVLLADRLTERYGDPAVRGSVRPPAGPRPDQDGDYAVTVLDGGPLDALHGEHGLVPLTVTEARPLTAPGHPRLKQLLRLALPDGTAYRTGDHLAVLCANPPGLVQRAADVFRAEFDTVLDIRPLAPGRDRLHLDRPVTVRALLTHYVELQDRPTVRVLERLAGLTPCPREKASLTDLAEATSTGSDPGDRRTILDLVEDHPAVREVLDWPSLLDLLAPRRLRHYSISSSPARDPRRADLMVSLLRAPARSRRGVYTGSASGYLASLRPGDTVAARVHPCREVFRVEPDTSEPLIMIAAGTGLAPFRGAVADRAARGAAGGSTAPALLYFGCDDPEGDYLHAAELRAAEAGGAVSLRPVFSERPEHGHRFVQHRIAAEAEEVWALLSRGARVRVCGDGARMAPGVREAFREVFVRRTGAGADEASAWLDGLIAEERYVEDVYAAG
ncbi:cytochrome P450 [Streptomyces sp. NPDC059918]|uniref:bifunctional cytochrome P450/NADPH--P450 reductase n=1 Tax=unclassified Streptomyces TaxID=2593676 RepID=UPI0036646247